MLDVWFSVHYHSSRGFACVGEWWFPMLWYHLCCNSQRSFCRNTGLHCPGYQSSIVPTKIPVASYWLQTKTKKVIVSIASWSRQDTFVQEDQFLILLYRLFSSSCSLLENKLIIVISVDQNFQSPSWFYLWPNQAYFNWGPTLSRGANNVTVQSFKGATIQCLDYHSETIWDDLLFAREVDLGRKIWRAPQEWGHARRMPIKPKSFFETSYL